MLNTIDLFSGIGGIRIGFEQACRERGIATQCLFTSEIKPHAISVFHQNHPGEPLAGDITKVETSQIPRFDILLAGFPCQAFSAAGKRLGFDDTRGTLFFDVARILKDKQPQGFILENVEGLVNHDRPSPRDPMGRTLSTILATLDKLGYQTTWKVLNAKHFAVPQERKRIYIVGTRSRRPDLEGFQPRTATVGQILERGLPGSDHPFVANLLSRFSIEQLLGKSLKDKRGGIDNIHSWDIAMKGPVTDEQKALLDSMLKERRKKKWAAEHGIDWMDGMPLTQSQISTFFPHPRLADLLADLVAKGYLKREHPKQRRGAGRVQDTSLPLGYNIVAGKMSFKINKILHPDHVAPTLVAMDMERLYVADGQGLRPLTLREGLRLFGYPDNLKFDIDPAQGYDLLGNTVVVPVIKAVAGRLLDALGR